MSKMKINPRYQWYAYYTVAIENVINLIIFLKFVHYPAYVLTVITFAMGFFIMSLMNFFKIVNDEYVLNDRLTYPIQTSRGYKLMYFGSIGVAILAQLIAISIWLIDLF